jgi:uncharacterized protein
VDERRLRCADPPPEALIEGVRQFNRREFFECHETLEALWKAEPASIRELYQGILQVGVGLYHAERGNYAGATLTLGRGLDRLRRFPPECHGIDVDDLIRQAEAAADQLHRLGPQRIQEFDPELVPVIHLRRPAEAG